MSLIWDALYWVIGDRGSWGRTGALVVLLVALLVAGWLLLAPQPASCTYCGNLTCIRQSDCFQGCVCVDAPSGTGVCVAAVW